MKKIFLLFLVFSLFVVSSICAQNIGIGTTTPNSSAMLDVQSTNRGMLVPRIALTALNTASPVTSPADALLVYNTATAGVGNNAVVPGFYYWSSTGSRWSPISPTVSSVSTGFGSWGDCSTNNISEYNPVADADGAAGDRFGSSVSISGNYAIVGAPYDGAVSANQGSASIYQWLAGNWVLMQKLTDATGAADDNFGSSVSISGNYAIVGAYLDDGAAGINQGSASIYQWLAGNWVLMQKLTDATGAADDIFGNSVSISGNYAIVGAPYDDGAAGIEQGSVCIYQWNGSAWVLMQKLTDATGAADDIFGISVSISGNYIIVGANRDDGVAGTEQGSASIYQWNGSAWVLMQKLTDATGAANDYFGISVSISGNYAIVGARWDDGAAATNQGSASIYQWNGSNWVLMQKLTDVTGASLDEFGSSVSISGNYAIVGAHGDDGTAGADQGSSTIYLRVGLGWQRIQYTTDPGGGLNHEFGTATAIDGTTQRFLIGAKSYANNSGKIVFGKIN